MIPSELIQGILFHFKFFDIFIAFFSATMLFSCHRRKKDHFWRRLICLFVPVRVLCLVFAYTYGGSILIEAIYSGILITLILLGLRVCYDERTWNLVFYFSCGFMTWYITDRLFLVTASVCRLNAALRPYFVEGTISHILLYIGSFAVVYLFIYLIVGRRMSLVGESEIPAQNTLLSMLLVSMLTPIFYFESQAIAKYNLFFYNLLNLGEIIFYVFMLLLQVLVLESARERTELYTMQRLWRQEQKQYQLIKENIEALNIKCHDLKHQIRHLRETGAVDPAYLDDLERSVAVYNCAVRTGNDSLDVVLTDKRLHCVAHGIQFTCMAEGSKISFMANTDIFSLFGNILDNAIEHELTVPPESRFIHLSVRAMNQILLLHAENHLDGEVELWDGLPVTSKSNKNDHGYGMRSIRYIVEKYHGNLSVSAENQLFQIDIMLPIPSPAPAENEQFLFGKKEENT